MFASIHFGLSGLCESICWLQKPRCFFFLGSRSHAGTSFGLVLATGSPAGDSMRFWFRLSLSASPHISFLMSYEHLSFLRFRRPSLTTLLLLLFPSSEPGFAFFPSHLVSRHHPRRFSLASVQCWCFYHSHASIIRPFLIFPYPLIDLNVALTFFT